MPACKWFRDQRGLRAQGRALKFIEYLTSPESATKYAEYGAGIPIVKGVDTTSLEGAFKDGADLNSNSQAGIAPLCIHGSFFLDGCQDVDGVLTQLDTDFDNLQ